jgi:hypothetical protein
MVWFLAVGNSLLIGTFYLVQLLLQLLVLLLARKVCQLSVWVNSL